MYSLLELEAMAPAEIISIAEGMGMKKASSADILDVCYYILDNQAITNAKEEASKVAARQTEGKKRGRKKKTAEPEAKAAAASETAEAQPEKPRRGRKPKAAAQDQQDAPKDDVQPAPAADQPAQEPAAEPEKKRRGRKSKAQKEAEAAKAAEAQAPNPEIPAVEPKLLPASSRPENQNQNAEKGAQKNTFDSFFGKTKGRTFTPRGQQPQQQNQPQNQPQQNQNQPQPQPQQNQLHQQPGESHPAPQQLERHYVQRPQHVIIQEPGANTQTPKNQQQQKNKKGKFNRQQEPDNRFPAAALEGKLTMYGVLEVMPEGFGFLRSSDFNYLPSPDDVYVSQQQIKQYGLRMGDVVEASVRLPLPEEKYYPMVKPITINGLEPSRILDRAKFEHLVPLFPDEKFEITKGRSSNISTRIVDMFAPIGKGQRALIVAPPKTGKTILLKDIANAISENHPETYIIMLLIDERPEEVTDMARSVNAEVIASTFDEPADRHVRIAGIVLEKAKRLVESGHDVVIMLDSITRLARAYNTVSPASGKILSGGVDANALQRPKRFFGAARNIEGGGSLTIIATALTETSSKMDEVIFEEFKGTGNMELQLDRKLSNKRIFPAVDIVASSTRRDDLLLPEETLNRMWVLRNYLGDMNSLEAMEFMKKRMEMTRSNEELLVTMDR